MLPLLRNDECCGCEDGPNSGKVIQCGGKGPRKGCVAAKGGGEQIAAAVFIVKTSYVDCGKGRREGRGECEAEEEKEEGGGG